MVWCQKIVFHLEQLPNQIIVEIFKYSSVPKYFQNAKRFCVNGVVQLIQQSTGKATVPTENMEGVVL